MSHWIERFDRRHGFYEVGELTITLFLDSYGFVKVKLAIILMHKQLILLNILMLQFRCNSKLIISFIDIFQGILFLVDALFSSVVFVFVEMLWIDVKFVTFWLIGLEIYVDGFAYFICTVNFLVTIKVMLIDFIRNKLWTYCAILSSKFILIITCLS